MSTQKVELPLNVPVPIVLASLDGLVVPSRYGPTGQQTKFTTRDGRAVYVPLHVGDQVKALGSHSIRLTKKQDAQRRVEWAIEKLVGEHGGQFFIPKEKADSTTPPGIKPASSSNATKTSTGSKDEPSIAPRENQRKSPVRTHVSTLIDVYAESAQYAAQKHAGTVTSADVLRIVLTVYIQQARALQTGGRR